VQRSAGGFGGATVFDDSSTAGNGIFTNNGGAASGVFALGGGNTIFLKTSTAANGTFINNGATASGAEGGVTEFGIFPSGNDDSPSAGNATIINNGAMTSGAVGGKTIFYETSTADSATLIANSGTGGGEGGQIFFNEKSTGGTSRVELFGNGSLDISAHAAPGVTIGSIEGDGTALLGANNLTVGSNNLSTTFSGVIQDGGQNGGVGGSLTKIGSGTLVLSGANTYTGSTNVNRGVLQVDGSINSNTSVHGNGTLAGTGTVNGNVTNNNGGKVSPGEAPGVPGVLTIVQNYTQAQYASLMIQIAGMNAGQFSVLDVLGTANLSGRLDPVLLNGFIPTIGQSFTFLTYAAVNGTLSIFNPNIDNEPEHWVVSYQATNAILTVAPGNVPVPDQGSTFLLLMLGLLGLVTYWRQLLRGADLSVICVITGNHR